MSNFLISVINSILLAFGMRLAFWSLKKEKKTATRFTKQYYVISVPRIVLYLGIMNASVAFIMLMAVIFGKENTHWLGYLLLALYIAFGLHMVLIATMFKVIVNKECVTVYSPYKKMFTFEFADIQSAERQVKKNRTKSERIILRIAGGKKLIVESAEISYERFQKQITNILPQSCLSGFDN